MREHMPRGDAAAYAEAMHEHLAAAHATDGRTDVRTYAEPLQRRGNLQKRFAHEPPKPIHHDDGEKPNSENPFDVRADFRPRAERLRSGEREPINPVVRQLVYRRDNWTCQLCHARYDAALAARRTGPLHLDHIRPWSNWVQHESHLADRSDNLRALCGPCNTERSNRYDPKRDRPAVAIVGRCAWCFCADHAERPSMAFDVFCGSHNGFGWALPGWTIL